MEKIITTDYGQVSIRIAKDERPRIKDRIDEIPLGILYATDGSMHFWYQTTKPAVLPLLQFSIIKGNLRAYVENSLQAGFMQTPAIFLF